ncbi:sensor histidine kinase [Paenibacillus selenitireducens]|uniref:Oxygen sensor histidine kinase NreB n=1 Tax=Paenibacillus selenitireducens TaxID=1324314 RepID=A0A1T2XAS1_9BACL|nr:sensor histidine kinase [Paenibacillus selenitireducens]OPA76693.1 sensor histidine kinase [Paenibacillus selenitireducens]
MITRIFKNTKWGLLLYFALSSLLSIVAVVIAWFKYEPLLTGLNLWVWYFVLIVVVSTIAGYAIAQRNQRRIDAIHDSMLQVSRGNLSVRLRPTEDPSFSRLYYEFNTMVDAVEKKMKLLQKLGESNVMQLEKTTELAVLDERKRLARDLHDSVSQQLFAIHMSASSLPKVMDMDMDRAKMVVEQLIQMSYLAQKQMRGLIAQLRPLELEGKTLAQALDSWFPDYCRHNGLQGTKELEIHEPISEAKEHQLFLIIQEAMANIVKHASASVVTLKLTERESQYILSINDDGKGFNQTMLKPGSYGLSTMQERAEKLGGRVDIISQTGAGTTIRVHIPKFEEENEVDGTN